MFRTLRRIHFVGIGGIGMSGIAEVLLNSGYEVSGSNIRTSPVIERLRELGAVINIGHDAKAVREVHVVVVSSAISKHNPEVLEAASRRIPVIHRSEMLAELMRLKHGIVVSGTHGKTTSTSILATVLTAAGLDPTVVIGGRLNAYGSNAKIGQGEYFVAEADESDESFLRLSPAIAVITNIDRDHLDHYANLDAIVAAFKGFLDRVPFYGAICACIDDPGVQLLLPHLRRKLVTFGLRPDADITARDVHTVGCTASFTPVVFGKALAPVSLKMPGKHNVINALGSFAVASVLEIDPAIVGKAIAEFEGVLHRSTIVGQRNNAIVIDDYAHNPRKIQAALEALREGYPGHHLCAVFQPHRYSRIKHMGEEFARSFLAADSVIVTPIYSAGESPVEGITQENLTRQIRLQSFAGHYDPVRTATDLRHAALLAAEVAKENATDGCVIVTLGAGDVAHVGSWIIENIGVKS